MRNKKSRKDWCKLPYALILDESLSAADAVVYSVLNDISFGGVATTTLPELVKKTGVPLRTLNRCLKKLKDEGYIVSTKSDGRKLAIVIEQVIGNSASANEHKPNISYSGAGGTVTDSYEKMLVDNLEKKMYGSSRQQVLDTYEDLKMQAKMRVNDPSKLFAYLSKMIQNYEPKRDNSDGALIDEYNKLWNDF